MASVLGLDIGGANLKAATSDGLARSIPFPLWKNPSRLSAALRQFIAAMPAHDTLAVTMTGELCDCYANRRDGVNRILGSVEEVAGSTPVRIWTTQGRFLAVDEARRDPLSAASANWLAQATWAGRLVPSGNAILLDMGSTTTDVIPLSNGKPVPHGFTDAQRLKSMELLCMGWRRTPAAAILNIDQRIMTELFATTLDACLVRGVVPENQGDRDTADGRPATKEHARRRLARLTGEDEEPVSREIADELAEKILARMESALIEGIGAITDVFSNTETEAPSGFILAGSGEPLLRRLLAPVCKLPWFSLAERLGSAVSDAACAYAVAVLAAEAPV